MGVHAGYLQGIRWLIEHEPGWPSVVARYRDATPDWEQLRNVVEQEHWRSQGIGLAADITAVRFAYMRMTRDVLMTRLPVEGSAKPNADADGNNGILSSLQYPFNAYFVGDNSGPGYNDDGYLRWSEALQIDGVTIPPGEVPLEVGTTKCSTTAHHVSSTGVARWPYGFDEVWLIVRRRHGWAASQDQQSLLGGIS